MITSILRIRPFHSVVAMAFGATLIAVSATDARADTQLSTNLSLYGSAFGLPLNSNLFFDDDFGLNSYRVFNDTRQGTNFGTLSRSGRTLGRTPFDLSLVPDSARTLSLGVPTGTAFTTLLAGRAQIETEPNSFDSTNFFGARVSHPLGENLVGSVSLLRANDASEQTGRDIGALGLTWTPDINRRVNIEIAQSKGGNALQINGGWRNQRVLAFAGVRRAGDNFLLLDNTRIERRNGGFAYLDYSFSPKLNLIGATQRFSDGARRRFRDDNLRLEYSNRRDFNGALFAFDTTRSGFRFENPLDEFFSLQGRGLGARVSQNFGRTRVTVSGLRFRNRRDAPIEQNGDGTQLGFGVRHYLDKRTRLFANATVRRENNDAFLSGERRSVFALAGAERRFGQRRGPTLSAAVDSLSRRTNGDTSRSYGLRLAAYASLNDKTSFSVSWRAPFSSSGIDDTNRVFLGISHRFGDSQARYALEEQRLLARVRGRVFDDRNLNGVFDASDVGLPEVRVQTAFNRISDTESDGAFAFESLIPGPQKLSLVVKTLPIEYSMLQSEFTFEGRAGRVTKLDIPVVRGGKVSGVVFRDDNRNGVRDAGEIVLPNVVVTASGTSTIAFSDSEGRFVLNDLPPRTTNIGVNLDTIARGESEDFETTRVVQTSIPSGGSAPDVQLGVALRPREIENSFPVESTNGANR